MRNTADKMAALLWCLKREPRGMTAVELGEITGMWAATVTVNLWRLEQIGKARMRFDPGPYPRRARYFAWDANSLTQNRRVGDQVADVQPGLKA